MSPTLTMIRAARRLLRDSGAVGSDEAARRDLWAKAAESAGTTPRALEQRIAREYGHEALAELPARPRPPVRTVKQPQRGPRRGRVEARVVALAEMVAAAPGITAPEAARRLGVSDRALRNIEHIVRTELGPPGFARKLYPLTPQSRGTGAGSDSGAPAPDLSVSVS